MNSNNSRTNTQAAIWNVKSSKRVSKKNVNVFNFDFIFTKMHALTPKCIVLGCPCIYKNLFIAVSLTFRRFHCLMFVDVLVFNTLIPLSNIAGRKRNVVCAKMNYSANAASIPQLRRTKINARNSLRAYLHNFNCLQLKIEYVIR